MKSNIFEILPKPIFDIMELNEAIRATKQTFLYQNIVEHSYDAEQFSDYMMSLKPNGVEIDNWTLEELMKVVEDFKRLPDIALPRIIDFPTGSTYKKIELTVEENEIFRITINEIQSSVLRSYADVLWIAKTLSEEYPSLHVFRPVRNKYFVEGEAMVVREEHMCQLKYYLEFLFTYFYATNSPSLINFFTMTYDAFIAYKKVSLVELQVESE